MNIEIEPVNWNKPLLTDISSAWKGLENYIEPILSKFNIKREKALEFGVDHGFSAFVLSQLFDKVVGVDSFAGDDHIIHKQGETFYQTVKQRFNQTNVDIIQSSYQDFIASNNDTKWNLIHIDIVHYYDPTFECADWSVQHSDVVILHDTESFTEIKRVCIDIAKKHNLEFCNLPNHFGLGILYRNK